MSHNETRISNERLAATIQRLIGKGNAMVGYMDSPEAIEAGAATSLASWQRETEAAMGLALQALRSTPVEAESVVGKFVQRTSAIDALNDQFDAEDATAHPLPNPSPSDGEVSDVLRRARNYIDDMPHLFPENAHPNDRDTHRQLEAEREPLLLALTAAIQSKRGQP